MNNYINSIIIVMVICLLIGSLFISFGKDSYLIKTYNIPESYQSFFVGIGALFMFIGLSILLVGLIVIIRLLL